MLAAVLRGKEDISIEEVEIPKVSKDFILVRVKSCAICGSDLMIYNWSSPEIEAFPPRPGGYILGHEFSGEVYNVGEEVSVKKGDRIAAEPEIYCGNCIFCKVGQYQLCNDQKWLGYQYSGGYAEYTAVLTENIVKLPQNVSFDEAAMLDTLSISLQAVYNGKVRGDDIVTVIGLGSIGQFAVGVAKAFGAKKVIGIGRYEHQIKVAEKMGADEVINSQETDYKDVIEYTNGIGSSVVIDAAGGKGTSVNQAIDVAAKKGRVIIVGIYSQPVDVNLFNCLSREVSIIPSWCYSYIGLKRTYELSLELVSSRKVNVKPVLTHTFPLAQINQAMETALDKKKKSIKVIINP